MSANWAVLNSQGGMVRYSAAVPPTDLKEGQFASFKHNIVVRDISLEENIRIKMSGGEALMGCGHPMVGNLFAYNIEGFGTDVSELVRTERMLWEMVTGKKIKDPHGFLTFMPDIRSAWQRTLWLIRWIAQGNKTAEPSSTR